MSTEVRVADSPISGQMTRAEPVPVGRCVSGRYRILGELGSGAFGTVYRAEDGATGHFVALRLLPPVLTSASAAAQSIRRASRSLLSVSTMYPALVHVLEYGQTEDGQLFVVTELVTGQSLSAWLSSAPLDVAERLPWAIELGSALETLHNAGYVHGGLRPRNVVMSEGGQLKLLDVELCGLRDQPELTDLVNEKPEREHLSPEQIQHDPVTEKTDIYAFALVVYEMLCGVSPFPADTLEAEAAAQLTATAVSMRHRRRTIPRSVDSAIMAALDTRQERRPFMHSIVTRLWAEHNRLVSDRRQRVSMVAFGAVIASLLLALGWMLWVSRPTDHSLTAPPRQETKSATTVVQPEPTKPSTDAEAVTVAEPARPEPPPQETKSAPALAQPEPTKPNADAGAVTLAEPARPEPPLQATKSPPGLAQPEPTKPNADAGAVTLAEPARRAPRSASSSPSRPPSSPPSSARKVERREQVPDPSTSPAPTPDRPNATSGADDPDPGLVVDWLLERAAGRRQ